MGEKVMRKTLTSPPHMSWPRTGVLNFGFSVTHFLAPEVCILHYLKAVVEHRLVHQNGPIVKLLLRCGFCAK